MRRLWAAACLMTALGGAGCSGRLMWVPYADPCATPYGPSGETIRDCPPQLALDDAQGSGPKSAPSCEPKAPKTVFVRGPQQHIVLERDCPKEKPKESAPKRPERSPERAPEAAPGAAQDVILVPRTVYVPYVAQTPTRAARLVTPAGFAQEPPPPTSEQNQQFSPKQDPPKKEDAPKTSAAAPTTTCPTDCPPTTIIEIRQMNERIDRLHRILERLCAPGQRP